MKTSLWTGNTSRCRHEPACRVQFRSHTRLCGLVESARGMPSALRKRDLGMLFFAINTAPEALAESIAAYRANIGNAQPYAGGVNNQVAGFVNSLCAEPEKRDEVRWLAATKMVEHTRHGSHFMTTGWPDPENIPPSYAHVMQGDTMDFKKAIEADPDGVAQGLTGLRDGGRRDTGRPS